MYLQNVSKAYLFYKDSVDSGLITRQCLHNFIEFEGITQGAVSFARVDLSLS